MILILQSETKVTDEINAKNMQMRDELFHWKQASEDQEQLLVMKYSNHRVFQIQIKSWER